MENKEQGQHLCSSSRIYAVLSVPPRQRNQPDVGVRAYCDLKRRAPSCTQGMLSLVQPQKAREEGPFAHQR